MLQDIVPQPFAFGAQNESDRPRGEGRGEFRLAFTIKSDAPVAGFCNRSSARDRLTTRTQGTTSRAPDAALASVPDSGGAWRSW
jgi:hypothetical protein